MKQFKQVQFCDYCGAETEHLITDAEHERDSSHDREECLECHSYRFGWSDKLTTPPQS